MTKNPIKPSISPGDSYTIPDDTTNNTAALAVAQHVPMRARVVRDTAAVDQNNPTHTAFDASQRPQNPLIAHLWSRAKEAQLALLGVNTSDPAAVEAAQLHLRCLALLIASTPAQCLDDVEPKVLLAAFYRERAADGDLYVLGLIERCITCDMARLAEIADAH